MIYDMQIENCPLPITISIDTSKYLLITKNVRSRQRLSLTKDSPYYCLSFEETINTEIFTQRFEIVNNKKIKNSVFLNSTNNLTLKSVNF